MKDIDEHGAHKAAEIALDMAWEGCKAVYLSFDIDSIDRASRRARDRRNRAACCRAKRSR